MRSAIGAFGVVAGIIVIALVGRYGFATSDTRLDGAIAAFFFGVIAVGGIAGPAVATRLFRGFTGWAKLWGVIAGALAIVALVANLSNSLGAIAGRADKTLAERQSAASTAKDTRAAIDRITGQIGELGKFTPATADDVAAARAAVQAAEKSTFAECGDGSNPKQRGPRCLTREGEEKTARETLKTALASKSLTDKASRLNSELAAERTRLEGAPKVASANPMAETLGRIFHMKADDAATWQQVVTVIVVELLIAFSLIAWELLEPSKPTPAAPVETAPQTGRETVEHGPELQAEPARPMLPSPERSSVQRFMLACLPREKGNAVMVRVVYARYVRWCDEQEPRLEPLKAAAFFEQFAPLCEKVRIGMRKKAGKVHCIGVRLAA